VKPTPRFRALVPTVAVLCLGFGLTACGASNESSSSGSGGSGGSSSLSGTLNAAGSSAQEAAQGAWTKDFQTKNPDVTINYDPSGSGAGVDQFLAGAVQFAGSDAYLDDSQVKQASKKCGGDVIEVPDYISPIALVFNLKGVDKLNLSPTTAADIFSGKVTTWNDPEIKKDNPGASLPSMKITPVHRSDDSGTTNNFTDWLHQTAPSAWTNAASETWPFKSGEGAEGTSGVIEAVKGGSGTIGYADASQAGDLGKASIGVGSAWVAPEAAAAAKAVDVSSPAPGRGGTDLALQINRTTTAAGTYPLVLVSYVMACPTYSSSGTADVVKGYLTYAVSSQGQQSAASAAGSAPLSSSLSNKATQALSGISG
jgi:phosphate transport system substrate-binding protein